MLERRDTSEPMHVRTCPADRRALIRLVAAATIRERRLFRSALAQVRLLFESGVYSRGASIRSYTVAIYIYGAHSHICNIAKPWTIIHP